MWQCDADVWRALLQSWCTQCSLCCVGFNIITRAVAAAKPTIHQVALYALPRASPPHAVHAAIWQHPT